jgi:hypothetical protein
MQQRPSVGGKRKMSQSAERTSPAPRKPRAAKKQPTVEEIQLRAYEIYLERHGAPGNPNEDWLRAEREVLQEYAPKPRVRKSPAAPKSKAA